MKISKKVLLVVAASVLILFFVNEVSSYLIDLTNTKKELYKQNKITFDTIVEVKSNSMKSLALMLSDDIEVQKAYLEDNPEIIKKHLISFWEKVKKEELIHEIHFFKPPAQSFVNFSNFKSIGKDVSDVRTDIAWIISSFKSSSHIMMCKTYAGIRATFPIISDEGKMLGGLSMGNKIDWLPKLTQKVSKSDTFLVYTKKSTKSLVKKYYDNFMSNKEIVGDFILADKTIPISKADIQKIDFSLDIQDIVIGDKQYSLNIIKILDFEKNDLAYLCILNDLEKFHSQFIIRMIKNLFLLSIVALLIYMIFRNQISIFLHKIRTLEDITKELKYERNYVKKILDLTPDITIVMYHNKLSSVNQRFFEFFGYKTVEDFLFEHDCICDYFISFNEKEFAEDRMVENIIWSTYIAEHSDKLHTVVIKKDNSEELFYFNLNAVHLDDNEILITLQNNTESKKKDKLLFEQSKMASMGEMISNIAHQWRQPLSIISTSATGMQMQKEYGVLSDKLFNDSCEMINNSAQYLSKTIDDFKNFIKGDSILVNFDLKNDTDSFLKLVDSTITKHHINVVLDLKEDIRIEGYPNELIQCFVNIFNNATDALLENNENNDRYIFISQSIVNNNVIISFKDNAGGISEDILSKIFEPYFTTKHKSKGTGLGLSMSYNIITGMNGILEAHNVKYEYDKQDCFGAELIITLPING